ncbi:DNA excision repair protein ERCC-6 [Monoraphidium neglectum]|uniref:DNA excision repair protein ERCC-6 n=1 Tax=Monoraphidium neglectum TaxID=145388 RepID=A0A0D2KB83_9CHLO|nr:DNA excision repair protein ERCC-6 [Monoraphidium neglectum]KIZ07478.1 DNA excision repair protein ERCC-6 [Monoraphidium neglectum]|eukprot:XP_013906497.1 DNA excision repair protein ERCC-6 [Monoraphidium neglectum]
MLRIIEAFIQREQYDYLYIDGTVTGDERQRRVDEFNSRPSVFLFLATTGSGGVGLNLTAANRVVVFDPSWDPSQDLQAQDRAYRLGQRRDVQVYRLLATGTMEEMIYKRQVYKQQQTNQVIYGTTEKRHFEGVKGHKGKVGELFGIINLLKYTPEAVDTADIAAETAARLANSEEAASQGAAPADAAGAAAAAAGGAAAKPSYVIVTLDRPLEQIVAENAQEEEEEEGEGDASVDEEGEEESEAAGGGGDGKGGSQGQRRPGADGKAGPGGGGRGGGAALSRRWRQVIRDEEDEEEEEEEGEGQERAAAGPVGRR